MSSSPPPEHAPPVPRRADAARNRARILAAARASFAASDVEVSMAEISRRAGVGMATLYRNFPGRRELLEALYTDEVDAVCAAATTVEAGARDATTPGATFTDWLHRFLAFSAGKRHIAAELLTHVDRANPVFDDNRARVLAAGRPLLVAAQRAGEIRGDLTLEQVLDMLLAVAAIQGGTTYLAPILQATLDGLRPATWLTSPAAPRSPDASPEPEPSAAARRPAKAARSPRSSRSSPSARRAR